MGTAIRCDQCGATAQHDAKRSEEPKYCTYCGATFRAPEPTALAPETPAQALERRFAHLQNHPTTRAAMETQPSAAPRIAARLGGVVFSIAIVVLFATSLGEFGQLLLWMIPGPIRLIGLLVLGIFAFAILRSLATGVTFAAATTESSLAHVLDESVEMRGSGEHVQPLHLLTLEDEAGTRRVFEVARRVSRRVTRGDMIVAYTRADKLIGLRILPS